MRVVGLQGSPRRKGNTSHLLTLCMNEAEKAGALVHTVEVGKHQISPCKEFLLCERKGYCPIDDDMASIYAMLRSADVVLMASPVFFYNLSAQLKALIDRCQVFWGRKYRLKLKDPGAAMRRGAMLSVAATHGKDLFTAADLTARYFFDALDAVYEGNLVYRGIEKAGDMAAHPRVAEEVEAFMARLMAPFTGRKRVLFACRENACRSQMAGAYAQAMAADRLEVLIGGGQPAESVNPEMVAAMAEDGVDMAFRSPKSIDAALREGAPELIVTLGCGENCPFVPGARRIDWALPDPAGKDPEVMRRCRDEIKKKVAELLQEL